MTKETLFEDLIKDLRPFDEKLVRALDGLREKQASRTVHTSRFELCRLLRFEYNEEHAVEIDKALERLQKKSFYLASGTSGFAIAAKAIIKTSQEPSSEQLVIVLGNLFPT